MLKKLFIRLLGTLVILLCYWLGLLISTTLNSVIPGAVCGLFVLLFLLFAAPSIKSAVSLGAKPLLSHMSIFFVPAVMGVGVYWAIVQANFMGLVVAVVFTTCLALGIQAKLTEWLISSTVTGQAKRAKRGR